MLKAGASAITISGTPISLALNRESVVMGSSIVALSSFLAQESAVLSSQGLGVIIVSLGGICDE